MPHNDHPEFVGSEQIKQKQKWQLDQFEVWAATDEWRSIHASHYDWWMFPIDQPSAYGFAWTVYDGDIAELKKDEAYIKRYLRGVELQALSWGWDLARHAYIPHPHPDQSWQDWPIRLYKCARSLKLFGFETEFQSMRTYAQDLIRRGTSMMYRGRDLGEFFR